MICGTACASGRCAVGGMLLLIRALQVLGIPVDVPALPGYGSAALLLALVDGARLGMTADGQLSELRGDGVVYLLTRKSGRIKPERLRRW
ncbi:MAG: hypothetical protein ACOYJA_10720 [Christensenellales bacterium]|jgi:hypothetical protein